MELRWYKGTIIGKLSKYQNNVPALQLYTPEGEPISRASVNLPEFPPMDSIWIKNYSENEGMVKALVEAGWIDENYTKVVISGYETIEAYPMTGELLELWKNYK